MEEREYISSKKQTKEWRKLQKWYISGKHNECENQQIKWIENIIDNQTEKTYDRINIKKRK
jgi:hypothetical protein